MSDPLLSNLDGYEVSRRYWLLPAERRTYEEVAKQLRPRDTPEELKKKLVPRIGKLIREWDQQKRVSHVVLPDPSKADYLPLLPDYEDQLRQLFGLRDAVVVDTTGLGEPEKDLASNEEAWNSHDDNIHKHLGVWAGRILTTLIRPNDTVGVGGGRAPYWTALKCNIPESSTDVAARVVSLTGKMTTGTWGNSSGSDIARNLDADIIAGQLKAALRTTDSERSLGCNITPRVKDVKTDDVNIAVIGIGALAGGHRLLHFEGFSELAPVKKELAKLKGLVDKCESNPAGQYPIHHWVGDVCNDLFLVDTAPPPTPKLDIKTAKALKEVIDRLNSQFVNTKAAQLEKICRRGVVLAVAGGRHKAGAIAHVLKQKPMWITHLVTDHQVARKLLADHTSRG